MASDASFGPLTARERDILCHLARGLSNAEIADRVFISEKTVRNHVTSIFSKLDVDSRAKAIVLAREGGLVKERAGHSSQTGPPQNESSGSCANPVSLLRMPPSQSMP